MTILIIDAYNMHAKYYFVNKDKGFVDPAITGSTRFISLIYRNIDKYSSIYVVLDSNKASHDKKKLFPEYKEGRSNKEEVFKNFEDFLVIISKLPKLKIIKNNEREADDIIACIALSKCKKEKIIIYSSDKDFAQLVALHENILWSNSYKDGEFIITSDQEIFEKFKDSKKNCLTDRLKDIIKWRVFLGDGSDGIPPAIPRLPKTKIKEVINVWEEDYLDDKILGEIITRIDDENLRLKLAENFSNIIRNYKLMSLKECIKDFKLQKFTKCVNINVDEESYTELFKKYKINNLT